MHSPHALSLKHATSQTIKFEMSTAVEKKKENKRKKTHTHTHTKLFYTGPYILNFPTLRGQPPRELRGDPHSPSDH